MSGVNWLKQILVMLLLAAWLPATSHCYLEEAGFLENASKQCCSDTSSTPSKGDPCDLGCKIAEKSGAKFQDDQKVAVVPAQFVFLSLPAIVQTDFPPAVDLVSWPPKALHLVQYVANTALPARAPSFVS